MKRFLLLSLLSSLVLPACTTPRGGRSTVQSGRFGHQRQVYVEEDQAALNESTSNSADANEIAAPQQPQPAPAPQPQVQQQPATPPQPAVKRGELPYGIPVPGKPDQVYSPYRPSSKVNVTGYPPGMEVKCPYTGKIFLVP